MGRVRPEETLKASYVPAGSRAREKTRSPKSTRLKALALDGGDRDEDSGHVYQDVNRPDFGFFWTLSAQPGRRIKHNLEPERLC